METYKQNQYCENCRSSSEIEIQKGISVDKWKLLDPKCPICGCCLFSNTTQKLLGAWAMTYDCKRMGCNKRQ